MDGKSQDLSNKLLDHALGGGNYSRPASVYLAAFGSNGAEFSGGGYARKEIVNDATNFPAASNRVKSNGAAIAFATASGTWPDCYRVKVYDAASGGNVLYSSFLGNDFGRLFTAIAAGDVITVAAGHGLSVDDRAVILAADQASLPTGLTDELIVWVKTVTGNDITVSLTQGGDAIDITGAGAGVIKKLSPKPGLTAGDVLQFGISELQFREA